MEVSRRNALFFKFREPPFACLAALKEAEPVRAVKAALHTADTISIETGGTAEIRLNISHASLDSQPPRPKASAKLSTIAKTPEARPARFVDKHRERIHLQQLGRAASFHA